MERCQVHDKMIKEVAAATEAVKTLKEQSSEIFSIIRSMSTDLTEALTRAQLREDAIAEIDKKIENGLKASIASLAIQVQQMVACNERRKKEKNEARERGVEGFFRKGWEKFKAQASFIIITTAFVLFVWLLVLAVQKATIFYELPRGLLKLFGIG